MIFEMQRKHNQINHFENQNLHIIFQEKRKEK
jgi:hypothetical protein